MNNLNEHFTRRLLCQEAMEQDRKAQVQEQEEGWEEEEEGDVWVEKEMVWVGTAYAHPVERRSHINEVSPVIKLPVLNALPKW